MHIRAKVSNQMNTKFQSDGFKAHPNKVFKPNESEVHPKKFFELNESE